MSADGVTFGQAISKARKGLGLSQKELAARVMKDEGGGLKRTPPRMRSHNRNMHGRSGAGVLGQGRCPRAGWHTSERGIR